ncbi:MAG: hypothetical protein ACOH2M_04160 [Cypionkella sp.]|jgi:hypothetical protein
MLDPILQGLIAEYGALAMLAAILRAALAKPPPDAADLSDHLRRDIGLRPLPPAQPLIRCLK